MAIVNFFMRWKFSSATSNFTGLLSSFRPCPPAYWIWKPLRTLISRKLGCQPIGACRIFSHNFPQKNSGWGVGACITPAHHYQYWLSRCGNSGKCMANLPVLNIRCTCMVQKPSHIWMLSFGWLQSQYCESSDCPHPPLQAALPPLPGWQHKLHPFGREL